MIRKGENNQASTNMVLQERATCRRSKIRLHKGNKWSTKEIVDFIMEIMKIIWITSMKYEIFYEKHFRGFLIQPGVILDSTGSFLTFWHF